MEDVLQKKREDSCLIYYTKKLKMDIIFLQNIASIYNKNRKQKTSTYSVKYSLILLKDYLFYRKIQDLLKNYLAILKKDTLNKKPLFLYELQNKMAEKGKTEKPVLSLDKETISLGSEELSNEMVSSELTSDKTNHHNKKQEVANTKQIKIVIV